MQCGIWRVAQIDEAATIALTQKELNPSVIFELRLMGYSLIMDYQFIQKVICERLKLVSIQMHKPDLGQQKDLSTDTYLRPATAALAGTRSPPAAAGTTRPAAAAPDNTPPAGFTFWKCNLPQLQQCNRRPPSTTTHTARSTTPTPEPSQFCRRFLENLQLNPRNLSK